MVSIKISRKGFVSVKLTNNLCYALHLLCSASLYEEGPNEGIQALRSLLPSRHEISVEASGWGYGVSSGRRTVRLRPELLPTLRRMLARVLDGGWPTSSAAASRIVEIDALPALQLLATAGD
jgi:hypothetical protein